MRRRSTSRGNAALEFALVLPLWFLVVAAIADFGWLFFKYTTLDSAADLGCRAGSLVDPGDADQHILLVQQAAETRMNAVLQQLYDDECPSCEMLTWTVGAPPTRTLVCRVQRDFQPAIGLFVKKTTLTTLQISRLEWQREGAPS